ncbi:hypothetical protein [Mycolicibacterium sp. CBMA 234]|uniref:hypothetical protein n=1 Tax=Mycolicibacterium sp. CBMA 234 TaxID=1918495 RepID=UPI0012DCD69B|nr:hypothetical protein [Mycolicibacterium sp. CBMA 234]
MAFAGTITDTFAGPDGLITAEGEPPAVGSPWMMTSGSLFRSQGKGWSGRPDAGSSGRTGSAVFRMVSIDRDFADVDVNVVLRVDDLVETDRTPAQDWDGAHVWVRYQSDRQLYAVSVDRRDGTMIIKKKCEGGEDNGGTYYELGPSLKGAAIPFGRWQEVMISVRDQQDGSVVIDASRDGLTISAVDAGIGCAPLIGGGGVGIRGDNAELYFAKITVNQ